MTKGDNILTSRPYISIGKAESEQLISYLLFIYRTVERYPGEIMVLRDGRKRQTEGFSEEMAFVPKPEN